MHRKIKRLNVFFFELVHTIINSSKYNHNFIKIQQLLVNETAMICHKELECRQHKLTIQSISLKCAIKKRFRLMNFDSNYLRERAKQRTVISKSEIKQLLSDPNHLNENAKKRTVISKSEKQSDVEKESTLNNLNDFIEKKTHEKKLTEMQMCQIQRKLRSLKHTENRLKQNVFGPHFAWLMTRKGFYKIADAGLLGNPTDPTLFHFISLF